MKRYGGVLEAFKRGAPIRVRGMERKCRESA